MRHTVFLLHGMGHHPDGWAESGGYIGAIKDAYAQYPGLASVKFDERFEIVPIRYDNVFSNLVTTWQSNAELIGKLNVETGAGIGKLTNWLSGAGEVKDNFAWSHAVDVLLYRGIRLVREAVCTHVANQLITEITKRRSTSSSWQWSVIAHSLGTAVLHDTLARVAMPNDNWKTVAPAFSFDNENATVIMMVANVSRVLELNTVNEPYDAYGHVDDKGNYSAPVAPGFAGQKGRACAYYLNVRHKLDLFTIPKMFDPIAWPDPEAAKADPPRYLFNEIDHIHDVNVHDFAHYFCNPKVHVPFFQLATTPALIPDAEYKSAIANFPPFGTLGKETGISLRSSLLHLLPGGNSDWTDFGAIMGMLTKAMSK